MPSYHENCGKPGPKSISWIPPPEARLFKSRSAPGSPLFDRNEHFSRSAKGSASFREPRHTRASFLMRESQMKKAEKYKNEKGAKIGRSKSFTSRITSKLYNRSKYFTMTEVNFSIQDLEEATLSVSWQIVKCHFGVIWKRTGNIGNAGNETLTIRYFFAISNGRSRSRGSITSFRVPRPREKLLLCVGDFKIEA